MPAWGGSAGCFQKRRLFYLSTPVRIGPTFARLELTHPLAITCREGADFSGWRSLWLRIEGDGAREEAGLALFPHMVGVTFDVEDGGTVEESVQGGGGHDRVAGKDMAPLGEGLVGGDDGGELPFVADADDLEEERWREAVTNSCRRLRDRNHVDASSWSKRVKRGSVIFGCCSEVVLANHFDAVSGPEHRCYLGPKGRNRYERRPTPSAFYGPLYDPPEGRAVTGADNPSFVASYRLRNKRGPVK
jgi:hypothetical protein